VDNETLKRLKLFVETDFQQTSAENLRALERRTTPNGIGRPAAKFYDPMALLQDHKDSLQTLAHAIAPLYLRALQENHITELDDETRMQIHRHASELLTAIVATHRGRAANLFNHFDLTLPTQTIDEGIHQAEQSTSADIERMFLKLEQDITAAQKREEQKRAQLAVRNQFVVDRPTVDPSNLNRIFGSSAAPAIVSPETKPVHSTIELRQRGSLSDLPRARTIPVLGSGSEKQNLNPRESHWLLEHRLVVGLVIVVVGAGLTALFVSRQAEETRRYEARQKLVDAFAPVLGRFAEATFPTGVFASIDAQTPDPTNVLSAVKSLDSAAGPARAVIESRFSRQALARVDSLLRALLPVSASAKAVQSVSTSVSVADSVKTLESRRKSLRSVGAEASVLARRLQSQIVSEANR
jgi:hypothetical protein